LMILLSFWKASTRFNNLKVYLPLMPLQM